MTFSELGLKQELLDALDKLGFEKPTPIQEQAIPQILDGDGDLVGLAQTGTGKTAAFGLPMINLIDFKSKKTQGLVIAPTRELCIQICKDFENFARNFKKANIVPVYGGASIETQSKKLKDGAQIIVATPGRLMDMIRRRKADLSNVQFVALDEADEMLNMGFKEDIDFILDETPQEKRTWLFSATMPKEVAQIAKKYMNKPAEISVGTKNASATTISHTYIVVDDRDRYNALKRVLDYAPDIFGLIFCRTKRETQKVAELLIKDGYSADSLHGDLSQAQRDRVMNSFRNQSIQILVATDVAARGIDVDDITHVINYNLPDDVESYTHRSGRTGRAGREGESIIIVNNREQRKIWSVENIIKTKIEKAKIPTGEEVCEKQLLHLVDKVVDVEVKDDQIAPYIESIEEKFQDFTKEELIKHFVSVEFNRFLAYYKNARDINPSNKKSSRDRDNDRGREKGSRRERARDRDRKEGKHNRNLNDGSTTVFLNLGSKNVQDKGHLIRLICEYGGVAGKNIGRIRMMEKFSFTDLNPKVAEKVVKHMNGTDIEGFKVRAEISNS